MRASPYGASNGNESVEQILRVVDRSERKRRGRWSRMAAYNDRCVINPHEGFAEEDYPSLHYVEKSHASSSTIHP